MWVAGHVEVDLFGKWFVACDVEYELGKAVAEGIVPAGAEGAITAGKSVVQISVVWLVAFGGLAVWIVCYAWAWVAVQNMGLVEAQFGSVGELVVSKWDDVVYWGVKPGTGGRGARGMVYGHGAGVEGVGVGFCVHVAYNGG